MADAEQADRSFLLFLTLGAIAFPALADSIVLTDDQMDQVLAGYFPVPPGDPYTLTIDVDGVGNVDVYKELYLPIQPDDLTNVPPFGLPPGPAYPY